MKKFLLISGLCLLGFANPGFASSGSGCGVWGPVSYVWVGGGGTSGTNGTVLAIINGYVCIVSGAIDQMAPRAAILATAYAHGMQGNLTDNAAAINY
jgi:hypothetical protein